MSSRYTLAANHAAPSQRKSRTDGKVSLIPKPKQSRQGSHERLSETGWKPGRPRSLEPPRPGVPVGRHSREPSATKWPPGQRSRSAQQSNGRPQMTPISKPKGYSASITPMRTPSNDRTGRSWQNSLERALAFVTAKDKRPIADPKWQKETQVRVNEQLERRNGATGGVVLMKPLTITRFIDITSSLLSCLMEKCKIDSTSYITKLPHIAKRLLYPGVVSKSWLKTVNTLHTYPSALALISYLMDLVLRVEWPIDEESIYTENDAFSRLIREYLAECWRCFNQNGNDYTALNEEYLSKLRELLGIDDDRKQQLLHNIQEYHVQLNDPSEQAARADERRRYELNAQLQESLKEVKSAIIQDKGLMDAECHKHAALIEADKQLQIENDRIIRELAQLENEVASQKMTTAERALLLDKVDYSKRVINSREELVQQVCKMLHKTEMDLARSQKDCLTSCVEYNQCIISLTSSNADYASLAVEERDLMKSCTVERVEKSVDALRAKHGELTDTLREAEKTRLAEESTLKECSYKLDQASARLNDLILQTEQVKKELRQERAEWEAEHEAGASETAALESKRETYKKMAAEHEDKVREVEAWRAEEKGWIEKLSEQRAYIAEQRKLAARRLEQSKKQRSDLLLESVTKWNEALKHINSRYK